MSLRLLVRSFGAGRSSCKERNDVDNGAAMLNRREYGTLKM